MGADEQVFVPGIRQVPAELLKTFLLLIENHSTFEFKKFKFEFLLYALACTKITSVRLDIIKLFFVCEKNAKLFND